MADDVRANAAEELAAEDAAAKADADEAALAHATEAREAAEASAAGEVKKHLRQEAGLQEAVDAAREDEDAAKKAAGGDAPAAEPQAPAKGS